MNIGGLISELKRNVEKEKRVARELNILYKQFIKLRGDHERKMVASQIKDLKKHLYESNERASKNLKGMYLAKPLSKTPEKIPPKTPIKPPLGF